MVTPYMCTVCGKAHTSSAEVKNCDHKKTVKKKTSPKPRQTQQPKPAQ